MSAEIQVEVRLFATLQKYRPELGVGQPLPLFLPAGTTMGRLLDQELGIPDGVVKMILVNGLARDPDYALADGDRIGIFPPIAGG